MQPVVHVLERRTIFVALLLLQVLLGSLPLTTSFVLTKCKLISTVRYASTTRWSWRLGSAVGVQVVNRNEGEAVEETDYLVCGGGPAGLLCAIMLAQKFPNVSFIRQGICCRHMI
jgi:hypothetical protein